MVGAIVVAGGLSRRMGRFKLLLPWQGQTVIRQVVATLARADVADIAVVTGHRAGEVAQALSGSPAYTVYNPRWADGEMLSSIQAGLAALAASDHVLRAALICLGDQPQMEADTVRAVVGAGAASGWSRIIIPSYQMRAGHPILLPCGVWSAVRDTTEHLRAVLAAQRELVSYITVATPTILADLDTPEDYEREQALQRPNGQTPDAGTEAA